MSGKLLSKHHLEFLSLKGGCTGSSESTLVKMPYCWKSRVAAHICLHDSLMTNQRNLQSRDKKLLVLSGLQTNKESYGG